MLAKLWRLQPCWTFFWFYFYNLSLCYKYKARHAALWHEWTDCNPSCTRRFCQHVIPVICGCCSVIASQVALLACFPSQVFSGCLSPTFIQVFISLSSQTTPPARFGGKHTELGSPHSLLCCPGRVRTRRQSSGSTGSPSTTVVDSRGRSRAKVVSQSQRMYCTCTSHLSMHPSHTLVWSQRPY